MFPDVTLILGGAASGKSDFAERLVAASGRAPVYLATAQAGDAEMAARIARHRRERQGTRWRTEEEPLDVAGALGRIAAEEAALVDCATLWLSNQLGAGRDVAAETGRLLAALGDCAGPVAVVTNELGQGIVPADAGARAFRDMHGRLNRQLAAAAGLVVLVTAGLPQVLKGALPEGVA